MYCWYMWVGNTAPCFTIPGTDGESIEQYSLAESVANGPTVLLFYPFDFSPVCVEQLCTFRDAEWLTFTEDVDVWGISPDSAHSHRAFSNKYDLQFPLLSDRLGEVADQFGLLIDEFEHHKAIPQRAIITIDSAQTIKYRWVADGQYQSPAPEEIEGAIAWYRDEGGF